MKRIAGFLLLASTLVLFVSVRQAPAMQLAPQENANSAQPQASNPASSHDRHHRRHSTSRRHRHHHKASTQP